MSRYSQASENTEHTKSLTAIARKNENVHFQQSDRRTNQPDPKTTNITYANQNARIPALHATTQVLKPSPNVVPVFPVPTPLPTSR